MKYEAAMEWAAALRSGAYPPGTDKLTTLSARSREVTGHCCLGVRCEMLRERLNLELVKGTVGLKYDGDVAFLPARVVEHDEFHDKNPFFEFEAKGSTRLVRYELSVLNDEGFTQDQLADVIERFWEQL